MNEKVSLGLGCTVNLSIRQAAIIPGKKSRINRIVKSLIPIICQVMRVPGISPPKRAGKWGFKESAGFMK